jgi:hypothetical protein
VCYATPRSLRIPPEKLSFAELLYTNKQMCQEAGTILYEQNTFVKILHAEDPVLFQQQSSAAHPFSRIRDLVIHLDLREQDWDMHESRLRSCSFAALAHMPKLRFIRLLATVGIRKIPFLAIPKGVTSPRLEAFPGYRQLMFNFFSSLPTPTADITFDMEALLCHFGLTPAELRQAMFFQKASLLRYTYVRATRSCTKHILL